MGSEGESRTGWGREFQSRGAVSGEGSVAEGFEFGCRYCQGESGGGSEGTGGAVGDEEVRRVGGARCWRALKVKTSILKFMCRLLGSQWRDWRMGVMCSQTNKRLLE